MALFVDVLLLDTLVILVSVIVPLVLYIKYSYRYWKRQGIQQLQPLFPFGNIKDVVFKKVHIGDGLANMYTHFKNQNIRFGGYYSCLRPELLVIHPEAVKDILVKDFQHFSEKHLLVNEKNEPLTANLIFLGGAKWKHLRQKMNPAFTSSKLKMMFNMMLTSSEELSKMIRNASTNNEPLDITDIAARYTTDSIGSCAFGVECNSLQNPNNDFMKYGEMLTSPRGIDVFRYITSYIFPEFMQLFKIRLWNKSVTTFFMNFFKEIVKYREEMNIIRNDFLHLLIQLKKKGTLLEDDEIKKSGKAVLDGRITVEEIAAQSIAIFGGGFDTSSITISHCMHELVRNIDIQSKLREEILSTLSKYNGEITYDAVMEMGYLDQVVQETLRKYPPVSFILRKCTQDYLVPNTKCIIRKGQIVNISILGIHRDPEYYPEPDTFDPERFNEEHKRNRLPFTYIPFGEGPRICIGLRFGLIQAKVGIIVLLKNHRFTLNERTQLPVQIDPHKFVLAPRPGLWLTPHFTQ